MKLTKIQLKTLEFFHAFRTDAPTIGRLLSFNWLAFLQFVIIGILGYSVTLFLPPMFGWLIIGIAAGAFCREIARFRTTAQAWPLYREIINWQRVGEMLEADRKHDA